MDDHRCDAMLRTKGVRCRAVSKTMLAVKVNGSEDRMVHLCGTHGNAVLRGCRVQRLATGEQIASPFKGDA